MKYALFMLSIILIVLLGQSEQRHLKEEKAHEFLEQYDTRLEHCLNHEELQIVMSSNTLDEEQKNYIFEMDMKTCQKIESKKLPTLI